MDELERWAQLLDQRLGLDSQPVDVGLVLDIARDAAHGVTRPAAPVAAFMAGLAVARGMSLDDVALIVARTAEDWQTS